MIWDEYHQHMSLMSYRPILVYAPTFIFSEFRPGLRGIDIIAEAFDERCHFLIQPWWSLLTEGWSARYKVILDDFYCKHPNCKITFCAAQPEEHEVLASLGLSWIDTSHNAFVNEDIFTVLKNEKITYNAILNSRFDDFKRHHLAFKIRNCALVFSKYGGNSAKIFPQVASAMPTAFFINGNPLTDNYRNLSRSEINVFQNRSQVGLCLSAEEGANYSSIEYLVSGLPVVSTPSIGGRHMFFDDYTTIIAQPTPDAVAEATEEMISRNLDRETVRSITLKKVYHYRSNIINFIRFVQESYGESSTCERDFKRISTSSGGMGYRSVSQLRKEYEAAMAS